MSQGSSGGVPSGAEPPVRVLCVCTGNVCRSPAAERLLQRVLGDTGRVRSAGTRALVGQPVSTPMAHLLTDDGVQSGGFAARWLTEPMVLHADLVLALTREHRGDVVELSPAAVRRTFTLLEFARLLETSDLSGLPQGPEGHRWAAAVAVAAARRRAIGDPGADDVIDPFRQPLEVYRASYQVIRGAVERITACLGAAR